MVRVVTLSSLPQTVWIPHSRASRSSSWRSASTVISYSFRHTAGELLPTSISCETPTGFGPVLTFSQRVRLPHHDLAFVATLYSLLSHHSVWLGASSDSTHLHRSRALPNLHSYSSPFVQSHLKRCQFLPSWLRASSGLTQPHSSFVTVRWHGLRVFRCLGCYLQASVISSFGGSSWVTSRTFSRCRFQSRLLQLFPGFCIRGATKCLYPFSVWPEKARRFALNL